MLFGSTGEKNTRYQCPADFVSFSHKPCSSTLTESLKNSHNELWLIKAPASFDPEWCVRSSQSLYRQLWQSNNLHMIHVLMFLQRFTSQKVTLYALSTFTGCINCPNKLKLADIMFTEQRQYGWKSQWRNNGEF